MNHRHIVVIVLLRRRFIASFFRSRGTQKERDFVNQLVWFLIFSIIIRSNSNRNQSKQIEENKTIGKVGFGREDKLLLFQR